MLRQLREPVVVDVVGDSLDLEYLGGDSKEKFQLELWLENRRGFGSRLTTYTLRKCLKMGNLDLSQNQKGTSSQFSSQK